MEGWAQGSGGAGAEEDAPSTLGAGGASRASPGASSTGVGVGPEGAPAPPPAVPSPRRWTRRGEARACARGGGRGALVVSPVLALPAPATHSSSRRMGASDQ